jgi:hypothetical protein
MGNCIKEKEKSERYRVLLLGESQMRGCADLLKPNLRVSRFVEPGAKTSDIILDTNISKNMTKDDIVIVCTGSNDISKNNVKEGLKNIIKFVRRTSHTNKIVLEALHRYYLVDCSCVNKEIRIFNKTSSQKAKTI